MKGKLQLLILTTDTPHHSYFVKCIKEKFRDILVICEQKKNKFSYETNHILEKDQIIFEKNRWFKNSNFSLKNFANVKFVKDINHSEIKKFFSRNEFSLIFVFGTSILKKNLLKSLKGEILNFHGGDSELYRGLDSLLWSIYNEDFNNLVITLHKVDNGIDTGDILAKKMIPIKKNMHLKELRSLNTETCVDLAISAISNIQKGKKLNFIKQKTKGKYYSAMSSELKKICIKKFKKFTSNLN